MPSISLPTASPAKVAKLSLAALALAAIPAAHATLLSSESFSDYTNATQLDAQTAPTVAGYTGNWVHGNTSFGTGDVQSFTTGLTYSGLTTTGGSAGVPAAGSTAGSGRVARALDSSLTVTSDTATTIYLSFLYQKGAGNASYQCLELYNGINTIDTNSDATRAFQGGSRSNDYNFGVGNPAGSVSLGVSDTAVHQFIVKFDLSATPGADRATVWLDAKTETGGIVTSGLNLAWDTLSLADYSSFTGSWDEIRWGTSFSDVAASAIPEPSTYAALVGALSIGVVVLRRRRQTAA